VWKEGIGGSPGVEADMKRRDVLKNMGRPSGSPDRPVAHRRPRNSTTQRITTTGERLFPVRGEAIKRKHRFTPIWSSFRKPILSACSAAKPNRRRFHRETNPA
jgi:hypothetical protein